MATKNIPKRGTKVKIEKAKLEDLYLKKGLSQRECGEVFGVSQVCISNHLKKNGIKTKPYSSYGVGIGEKNYFYGKKHSKETIEKLKKHAKERFSVPENNPMYGRTHNAEAREKIAAGHRGKPLSDEHKKKISKAGIGRFVSEETRKKISKIHKGSKRPPMSDECKEKLRKASTGRKHTEAHKKHMSELYKGEKSYNWKGGLKAQYKRRWLKGKNNPGIRIGRRISQGMCVSLKGNKNGAHWEDIAGYSLNELKIHLGKLFEPGMSFENYGKWHIDHIIPKSVFNFKSPDDIDFKKCWALSNLQPLWAIDNIRKQAKLEKPFQPSFAFGGSI
jgi:hypothetical protein